ncbi:MAG: phosphotransferase [Alphaproteobacteria bacterium]|nr:phosphotransferase [Alphaproteobacteria bacterium]
MWKLFFDVAYALSFLIIFPRARRHFRDWTLFGYREKLDDLLKTVPELRNRKMRIAKGGGCLAFIFDEKDVYKVRKRLAEATTVFPRLERERRITNALRRYCTVEIPKIEIIHGNKFIFYKTNFIPGVILANLPLRQLNAHSDEIAEQLAKFLKKLHSANPASIADLKNKTGEHWCHTDLCSNVLINPKTFKITGVIDWEWCVWADASLDFESLHNRRRKMRKTEITAKTLTKYYE